MTRGIVGFGGYVPYRRWSGPTVSAVAGGGGRKGDPIGGVSRRAPRPWASRRPAGPGGGRGGGPDAVWFVTATPAYLDKTNATTVQAALRQPAEVAAFDFGGAVPSGAGAAADRPRRGGPGTTLAVAADLRAGLATAVDEAAGGDGAGAVLAGSQAGHGDVLAEGLGPWVSVTGEFVDRWRTPGEQR